MLRSAHLRLCPCAGQVLKMAGELKVVPKGRMFSVQYSLPRLPVPPLQQTMEKYLRSVQPLITEEEFKTTKQVCQDFMKSPGPELQQLLEKRAQEKTNWLSDWWKSVAYLDSRIPLVVNFNPAVFFPRQSYRGKDGQLRFAAKLIAGVLDFKKMIDDQTLPVDTLGGKPLCMIQYYQILSACRIPGLKKDSHVIFPSTEPDPPQHICVIHKNHIFSLDVYGSKGKPLSTEQLYNQLKVIVEQSQYPGTPVGLLTTLDRDSWGALYTEMVKDKTTNASLKELQRSIFVLCLDEPLSTELNSPEGKSLAAGEMLHGGGADLNSGNRWFDKTLQFIVGADGICGLNYEHTSAEGPPVAAMKDYVLDFVCRNSEGALPAVDVRPPARLTFTLETKALNAIQRAVQNMESLVKDLQLTIFTFDKFGKDFAKACRLSPDAFIQVALQLAYFRMYNRPCATYETASLRRFQLGRTDTIRSCSIESLAFTKGMQNSSVTDGAKIELLKQAINSHRKYTDEAIAGMGVDRHLLGLKLLALESGRNVPQIFLDTAFAESSYFKVSTSQVGAKHDSVLCFGPVVPDGYGLCYNPQNTRINFAISAFRMCSETDSDKFSKTLEKSLVDMHDLLAKAPLEAKL